MQARPATHPDSVPRRLAAPARCDGVRERILRLDRQARAVAAARERGLRALALTAWGFVRRRCWFPLGYARLGDCARERLGRSGRWVQDLAALGRAFQELPRLEGAVAGADGGRPLGRVAAVVVARVATPETVDRWIELARGVTVRELKEAAAQARRECDPREGGAPEAPDRPPTIGGRDLDDPGSPEGGTSIETPLGRADGRDVGGDSQATAAHRRHERVQIRLWVPAAVAAMFDETLDLYRAVVGYEATVAEFIDAVAAEAQASDRQAARDVELAALGEGIADARLEALLEAATDRWAGLECGPVEVAGDAAWQREIERLEARVDRGDAGELAERLRRLIDLEDEIEQRLGQLLTDLGSAGAWRELWFHGPGHYARERLGVSRTTAEDRLRLARGLARLPALRRAYEEGRLGLEATLLVQRILTESAVDREVERAWVEHAEQVTVRRLRDEARLCRRERVLRDAAGVPAGPASGPDGPPSDEAWYASLAREPGTSRARLAELARRLDPADAPDVFLRLRLPADVAEGFLGAVEAARAARESEAGRIAWHEPWPEADAPASVLAARTFSVRCRRVPSWVGLLALLEEFVRVWDPPADSTRRRRAEAVYRRAGFRCEVPGCTSRANLEDHHVVYRSHGGGDELWNRICGCRTHHQRGEHGGLLRCRGKAPLGLVWRLGAPSCATWWAAGDRKLAGEPG